MVWIHAAPLLSLVLTLSMYQLNGASAVFQSLSTSFPKIFRATCTSAAKEFFASEMPSGKEWKRKASDGMRRHNVDCLLRVLKQFLI